MTWSNFSKINLIIIQDTDIQFKKKKKKPRTFAGVFIKQEVDLSKESSKPDVSLLPSWI